MNVKIEKLQSIPTNIVTGFLGVGKTTMIMHLLRSKPEGERWAVLVNEFGEIGVDGSLFKGQKSESEGVYIREVPGGCMCCAAGLPMQIALNQLLRQAKPSRLLIEPTGLGHPKEVLEVLCEPHYRDILDIQKTVTLVDARKLKDTRYTENTTFNQQLQIADVVVGNKFDLYSSEDSDNLERYLEELQCNASVTTFCAHGEIPQELLQGESLSAVQIRQTKSIHTHKDHLQQPLSLGNIEIPECGYLQVNNQGEGYVSVGWRFSPSKIFQRQTLFGWLSALNVERMKAVFITDEGVFGYNLSGATLTEMELDDCLESRIEIIEREDIPLDDIGPELLGLLSADTV